jgi:hypothetical protein
VLPLHGFFYSVCFGLAGFFDPLVTSGSVWADECGLRLGLIAAILGLIPLYLAYYYVAPRVLPRQSRLAWPFDFQKRAYGNTTIYLFLLSFGAKLLALRIGLSSLDQITGAFSNFFFIFLLHAYWSGELRGAAGKIFAFAILPMQIVLFSGLLNSQIAGFVTIIVWAGIVQIATKKKLPYTGVIVAVGIFLLLQPVKMQYRLIVWGPNAPTSAVDRYKLFFGTAINYYFGEGSDIQTQAEGLATAFDRIDHLHTTAAIIEETPSLQPFLYGRTYLPLITKWVPRFIWPNKPKESIGNQWAWNYGFLDSNDHSTSFNLPWLPEMYMNFGMLGIFVVSFSLGLVFRFLRDSFWKSPANSSAFGFGLALGAPLFFPESNFSLMVGGIVITSISLWVLMYFLGQANPELVAIRK